MRLEELKKKAPHGYKKFEAALRSLDVDEETALQMWEDLFSKLWSVEILYIVMYIHRINQTLSLSYFVWLQLGVTEHEYMLI